MSNWQNTVTRGRNNADSIIATNSVIKNTYILLSVTLLFSAIVAYASMALALPHPGFLITIAGFFGLSMLVNAFKNSSLGILAVFAFTGFMGYTLGPILNAYTHSFANGSEIIATAFGLTAVIFLSLSAYAMSTKKDFSFMGGFICAASLVLFIASLASIFFTMPVLHLMISAGFVLISSGFILFETSQIIHGGERNYIMATISLYVSIYNLFISLLHILGALSGRND